MKRVVIAALTAAALVMVMRHGMTAIPSICASINAQDNPILWWWYGCSGDAAGGGAGGAG